MFHSYICKTRLNHETNAQVTVNSAENILCYYHFTISAECDAFIFKVVAAILCEGIDNILYVRVGFISSGPDGLREDQFEKQLVNFDSEISNWDIIKVKL
jgi:hypothetical protein